MVKELIQSISKHVTLTDEEQTIFEGFWDTKILEKGEYLLQNGDTCKTDNFVVSGALKAYYINPNKGKEEILYFAIANWWATDIESFQNQKPSIYNIQAIERTEVVQIGFESFQRLLEKIPKLERFFRIILENYLGSLQRRIIHNQVLNAEQRYEYFTNKYPEILGKVPNYLIASYLGITPEFLSRIRKNQTRS